MAFCYWIGGVFCSKDSLVFFYRLLHPQFLIKTSFFLFCIDYLLIVNKNQI